MLSRLNGAYSPQQVAVLYRVFDEFCDEATAARSTPLTETESKSFRDQVGRHHPHNLERRTGFCTNKAESDRDRFLVGFSLLDGRRA